MRRARGSRLLFLVCILAALSSIGARRGTANGRSSSQFDGLDRILSSIPTRNPWARWGMDWARWGKDFAKMWQLPVGLNYGPSSRQQRYPQSRNGGMYPGLPPYSRQPTNGFYPGEQQPYDRFDGRYSGNGRGRYPRSSPSSSYYGNQDAYDQAHYQDQAPRTLSSSHGYDSEELPAWPEHLLSDSAELLEQDQLMSEPTLQKPSTQQSVKSDARPQASISQ